MDLFDLTTNRVNDLFDEGFPLIEKIQRLILPILITTGDYTGLTLTWSQVRSVCQYVQEEGTGRLERVSLIC